MVMDRGMELHQAIYQFYLTQIQFGFYEHGEKLPSPEETCRQFHTSLDMVIPVYHRLRHEGYIALSKKGRAKVTVTYGQEAIERHIQSFYTERKESLIDLSGCIWPLLGQAQCFASTLQFLLLHDLRRIVEVLEKLGIEKATNILIPDINDF